MSILYEFVRKGGPAVLAILVLSVLLYSRCIKLLLQLGRSRRQVAQRIQVARSQLPALHRVREEAAESFQRSRAALGAMIAAAPLLGLLGTVSGMVTTFEGISQRSADSSMEGLAKGISEVLVATESGLIVAIPALLAVHLAHRSLRKYLQRLNDLERSAQLGKEP
ncbi:MAG TPA: MotA/TolQ/ExbB proton channel family protein [Opitutaceae bacterium]|jgi:biopolymer transport protein ExbB/TolQ